MRIKKPIMYLMAAMLTQGMMAKVVTIDNVSYDINESRGSIVLTDGKSVKRVNYDVPSSIQSGSTVTEIGERAFAECTKLESITFPSSLSRIGEDAFEGCTSLREIRILSSLCDIAPNAFGDNDSLIIRVPYNYLESYKKRKGWEKYADKLAPFYTITVEEHDFYEDGHNNYYVGKYYDWNKEVIYSYNVYGNEYDVPFRLNIGDYVYQIIKDGKYVPVSEEQKGIHLDNIKRNIKIKLIMKHLGEEEHVHAGKYFYKIDTETKTAFLTDRDRSIEDVVVPPSFLFEGERYTVKGVIDGLASAKEMRKTKRIELPRMISKLPSYICHNDTNLAEVVFSEYSRIDTIGDEAFAYCTKLEEITLPSKLTYLGKEAFAGTPLSEVTLLSGTCTLGKNAFGDVPNTFRIYVPSKYVQHYKRSASWKKYKDYIYAIEEDEENELRKMSLPMDEQLASFEDDEQEESSTSFQNGKVNVFNLSERIIKVNADASDWYENLPDGLYITNGKKHIIKDGKLYSGK